MNKKAVILPDYYNSSVNLVNSLLKYYGCACPHPTLACVDQVLAKDFKHVFLIVLDGMGSCILDGNLRPDSFLRRHKLFDFSAVYPCTTVAATTALQSGLTPAETGWVGWHQYFPALNKDVVLFLNTVYQNSQPAASYSVTDRFLPYVHINDLIGKQGNTRTSMIFPAFHPDGAVDFTAVCERIAAVSRQTDPTFTYVYWNEPDATMHEDGCYVQSTKTVLTDIDRQLALMAERLPADTLLLITPDHGMIDVEEAKLGNYPDLNECFYRAATMEPRCNSFYVKEDKKVIFEQLFAEYFPDFLLLTRDEAFNNQLFGSGEMHPELPGMLGNYFGMAIGSRIIAHDSDHHFNFKAHHAGLTADEMIIPLIAYYR